MGFPVYKRLNKNIPDFNYFYKILSSEYRVNQHISPFYRINMCLSLNLLVC